MISDTFRLNRDIWKVKTVSAMSPKLVDSRTGKRTVATTDFSNKLVRLSEELYGDFLMTVLLHELGHCTICSFHLLPRIHQMVYPEYWVDMEEFICNFLADYGRQVFKIAYQTLGYSAWKLVPQAMESFVKERRLVA